VLRESTLRFSLKVAGSFVSTEGIYRATATQTAMQHREFLS
jgi:hypothetical protein